jgi:hypothetical protein
MPTTQWYLGLWFPTLVENSAAFKNARAYSRYNLTRNHVLLTINNWASYNNLKPKNHRRSKHVPKRESLHLRRKIYTQLIAINPKFVYNQRLSFQSLPRGQGHSMVTGKEVCRREASATWPLIDFWQPPAQHNIRAALFTPRGRANLLCKRLGKNPHVWLVKRLKFVPTFLHLEARSISWYEFFNQKMHDLTWPELVELGAFKMKGQFFASRPMSDFNK